MKKATYLMVYLASLVLGLLLLIFSREPLTVEYSESLRGVVLAGGVVFALAGGICLLVSMRPKKDADGIPVNRPWYQTAMAISSIFWGVLLLCMSATFSYMLAVTSGISLILAGLAGVMWIVDAAQPYGASGWWYIVPIAVFGAGIVDITLVNDYTNFAQSSSTAAIVSGILLLCFSVNGLFSLNRRKRVEKEVIDSVNEIAEENKKGAA